MGTLRTRTVGGTVLLALLLVLAGCSGGGANNDPAGTDTVTVTETPVATTDTVTGGDETGGDGTDGEPAVDEEWSTVFLFNESEAYGYLANYSDTTTRMSWVVTAAPDGRPLLDDEITVNVTVGPYSNTSTGIQSSIFTETITEGSVGSEFRYVRIPVLIAYGRDLTVGNSWTVQGDDVTVGDGFAVSWDEARAEVTGTATVAGETCYTMELRITGNETGPTSCVKYDWPFALAVDTSDQDYRLADFQRP